MVHKLYCQGKLVGANESMERLEKLAAQLFMVFGVSDFVVISIKGRIH